ncbi:peptidoglycan/xylan/chitin deacetylase (PgdA/CDA1 family) [Mesorhizobium robiniae]|uniref:Chitooligosaccharide deacetylase n=1 Tax=Mesorhizobium robiniae TaxID=559315 RepID=A0ABV2GJH8_9HYPH
MENTLYSYSPIIDRPKIVWPNGARVAFYVGLNVEHFEIGKPSTSIWEGTANLVPDPLNYGWRDYGVRVGIWRMIESFDKYGIRPSVLLNSDAAERYPQIIRAGKERNWTWLAHGKTNSMLHTDMAPAEERRFLIDVVETIAKATGQRPKGWMGPGLTETFETPRILKELGFAYVLDWTADDQPFALNLPGMISVPYSVELNDLGLFGAKSFTGEEFYRTIVDQFDQLFADGARSGRVMALALHPFVTGQAFRSKYLDKALDYIASHEGVWLTTSDEIAEHYLKNAGQSGSANDQPRALVEA